MLPSRPQCCEAIYSSVSGLKAHLASCSKVSTQVMLHSGPHTNVLVAHLAQDTWWG